MHRLIAVLIVVGSVAACGWTAPGMSSQKPDTCTDASAPTPDTVSRAIAALPAATPGSRWIDAARGHTYNCRLYWVVAGDSPCCPNGIGTVEYQIGADGKLQARGPIPNQ